MNKGFFVVFLGIILGAMALIFVNQSSTPSGTGTHMASSSEPGTGTRTPGDQAGGDGDAGAGEPLTVAVNDRPGSQPSAPGAPQAPPARPEPAKLDTPKPQPVKPEAPRPNTAETLPAKPETPKPDAAKPEPAKAEPATTEPARPETPKPETPASVKPQPATPEPPKPEPEPAKPEEPRTPMTPVTSTPETPAKPTAAQTRKSLTLLNVGLHFRGNGMALRIEADGPFSYKTFALTSPDRYVVDLVGAWNKMRAPSVPSNNLIKGARAGKQPGGPRLVLDMQRPPSKHNVTWVAPNVLEIVIE